MSIERPRPDAQKLLTIWMQFEKGESAPGRVLADLKIAGMRELLDVAAEAAVDLA